MNDSRGLPDRVWPLLERIQRNYPHWPSTFSSCFTCGKQYSRGAAPCVECTKKELIVFGVDSQLVDRYIEACRAEVSVWGEIMDKVRSVEDD